MLTHRKVSGNTVWQDPVLAFHRIKTEFSIFSPGFIPGETKFKFFLLYLID